MADTRKPPLTVNADEIEVSQILLKLPVLFSESESRRYCFRVNWGSQRRRSNPLPKPFKAMGSQKINLKRKRESGDAKEHVSDATKFFNLWFKERKHDNLVAPTGIQMMLVFLNSESFLLTVSILVMQYSFLQFSTVGFILPSYYFGPFFYIWNTSRSAIFS
jgi:hypothetical protein